MSAITLDSLSAGCPVVTVSGTSMATLVGRFDAGAVVEDAAPDALWKACRTVMAEYPRYRENARRGGQQIHLENSWAPLIAALRGDQGRNDPNQSEAAAAGAACRFKR
jgi:hypothetical protein